MHHKQNIYRLTSQGYEAIQLDIDMLEEEKKLDLLQLSVLKSKNLCHINNRIGKHDSVYECYLLYCSAYYVWHIVYESIYFTAFTVIGFGRYPMYNLACSSAAAAIVVQQRR